jgi:hypothetical protein
VIAAPTPSRFSLVPRRIASAFALSSTTTTRPRSLFRDLGADVLIQVVGHPFNVDSAHVS